MLGEYPLQQIHKSMPNGLNTTLSVLEILFVSLLSYVFLSHLHWGSAICVCVYIYLTLQIFCVLCFSVLLPTKPRFSDPSHGTILQQLQPQRSNLVHEQWKLPLQHYCRGWIFLHQWKTGSLWKEAEAPHSCWERHCHCIFSLLWSQCITRHCPVLSDCIRHDPCTAFSFFFFFAIVKIFGFRGGCYWICGMCTARWSHVKNMRRTIFVPHFDIGSKFFQMIRS